MSKFCEICGKGPQYGHNVSHAHNVTKRRWIPNLQKVRAVVNGTVRRIRVCTQCIRNGAVRKVVHENEKPEKAYDFYRGFLKRPARSGKRPSGRK